MLFFQKCALEKHTHAPNVWNRSCWHTNDTLYIWWPWKINQNPILELIKTDVIAKCQALSKIDIFDQNNFKKRSKMHLCFQTEKELKSLLQKDLITLYIDSQFKRDACLFITKLLWKLLEKTPSNLSVLWNSVVLNRLNIINGSAENNHQKMKYLGWI